MYTATETFLNAMKADVRRLSGYVIIDYTDMNIDQAMIITASEECSVSSKNQVTDSILVPYANTIPLDGTWVLGDGKVLADTSKSLGWWGAQLSNASAEFSAPFPSLTLQHAARPIHDIMVVGDSIKQEYPVDFTVKMYNATNTLLYTETVTDNALINYTKTISSISSVTKQVLEITKWSHAGRQVKIVEFFTSIQEIYAGDDLFSINLHEQREVSEGSLPVGNIASNEIDIQLYNRDRKFDAGNTHSPLYGVVKRNRRIRAFLGIEGEGVPLGVFWSGDWKVPENELYAQTSGRDRLELLRNSDYSTSQVYTDVTLYDLAGYILADAGLEAGEYHIDTELEDFPVKYAYFTSQSHREALRKIVEACCGQAYCDRDGVLRVEGPSYLNGSVSVLTLTADDWYSKDNPSNYGGLYNYIRVDTQPLAPATAEEVYISSEAVEIETDQVKTMLIYYNSEPCINAIATVTGDASLTSATYYSWGASIEVTGVADGTFSISVTAQPLRVLNKERAIAQDATSIFENGKLAFSFPSNTLIQSLAVAQKIADLLLAYYKDPRRDIDIEWRGNPALLLGDKITATDSIETHDYNIVTQDINYDGTLNATLSGRKA